MSETVEYDNECPICFENTSNCTLPCKHSLCSECLNNTDPKLCPLCRKPFETKDVFCI